MLYINFSEWLSIQESYNQPIKGIQSRSTAKYKKSVGHYQEQSTLGTEEVDARQVMSLYGRVKESVEMVKMYDQTLPVNQQLLRDVSTIANLSGGSAFGMFVNSDNTNVIGQDVMQKIKLIYPNDPMIGTKIKKLSRKKILDTLPDDVRKQIDPRKIQPSDIIKIDVKKHLAKYGDSDAAVIEIASTIVHEATHVKEYVETGETFDGPGTAVEKAEASFKSWVKANWPTISRRFNFSGPYPF
jgi:hypothetical protein